jgi:hypothetical protein
MGKIMISENQYNKIKNLLIENAINEQNLDGSLNVERNEDLKSYGIDVKNGTLTLNQDFTAENAQGSGRSELKLFKGAVFKPGQNFASTKILVSNTTTQKVGSKTGGAAESPKKTIVHYYCTKGKFNIPGDTDTYYNEDFPSLKNSFKKMCELAKNPQVSSQVKKGLTTYNSKNPNVLIGKKDNTKKITIPANTGFSPNTSGTGVGFKVNYQNGWFDCKTSTFTVNKVSYTSKYLGETLSKKLCKTTGEVVTDKPNVGGGGGLGGSKLSSSSSELIADFQNYI